MKVILDNGIEIISTNERFEISNPINKTSFLLDAHSVGKMSGKKVVLQIMGAIELIAGGREL